MARDPGGFDHRDRAGGDRDHNVGSTDGGFRARRGADPYAKALPLLGGEGRAVGRVAREQFPQLLYLEDSRDCQGLRKCLPPGADHGDSGRAVWCEGSDCDGGGRARAVSAHQVGLDKRLK